MTTEHLAVTQGSGTSIAFDQCTVNGDASVWVGLNKIGVGAAGTYVDVTSSAPFPVELDKFNGTTVDTNSGSKSAGTLRVVLATDQPQLTNKLLVTPDSVPLPNHQSTNVDQFNGTTTDTNSGTKSAGTLRVVLATDQPQLTNKLLVTPDSVALPNHQSTNVDQWAGTTVDTNSGNKSSGTLRVVLATDQPALTNPMPVTLTQPTISSVTNMQTAATGNGNGTAMNVAGYETAAIQITGSPSGGTIINFEASMDNTTWVSIMGNAPNGALSQSTAAAGDFQFNVAGYSQLRARISAYSSGTITVIGYAVVAAGEPVIMKAMLCDGANATALTSTSAALDTNLKSVGGTGTDTNSGNKSAATLRVVLATDQPALTNKLLVTPDSVAPATSASGGATPFRKLSANNTTGVNVKGSAGTLYTLFATNTNSSTPRFVKLYDKSSAPTVGTDTPVLTILVPANSAGAGICIPIPPQGIAFTSGIGYGITGAVADNDTTAPAANEVVLGGSYA